MPTSYTTNLGLALPVQGELSGTWGDTVNNYITAYLESAVSATLALSTDANATLTTANGTALTSSSAQYKVINLTGARTAARTLTLPAHSQTYCIINATTGGFATTVVGAGPTTGVSVLAGETVYLAWNGADFVKIATNNGTGTFANVTTTGKLSYFGTTTPLTYAGSVTAAVQVGTATALANIGVSQSYLSTNANNTSGVNYTQQNTGYATRYFQNNQIHSFQTNGNTSLAAGSTITWITAVQIDPLGLTMNATGIKEAKNTMAANAVDLALGNYFSKTISGATSLTVSNVPATGTVGAFILDLTNGGSATITWFTGTKWAGGTAPTLTAAGRDILGFFTHDGGTTWNGLLLGKAMA